jgi:hypothetical protein
MTNYAKKRPDWIENPTSRKDGEKWGTHLHCLMPDIQAKKSGDALARIPFRNARVIDWGKAPGEIRND